MSGLCWSTNRVRPTPLIKLDRSSFARMIAGDRCLDLSCQRRERERFVQEPKAFRFESRRIAAVARGENKFRAGCCELFSKCDAGLPTVNVDV
ncbi:hypothetical protein [uncultured Sulfitobacter sp.]|uniref:hypothetical protein n=1 Tax=uncultured Sulfitobacter sp. TaxID=191468 RepID=UPI002619D887|nr:hypothetical protein [uncultured Sulfitobacter sp.]